MKTNKFALSLLTLGFSTALIFSCKKPNNVAPVADTETQSAIDAVWATFALTDIEQICAFTGEDQKLTHFYREIPGSFNPANNTGSMTVVRDTTNKNINVAFNKTRCYDGRFREGSVFMFFSYDKDYDRFRTIPENANNVGNINYKYMHDGGFIGRISLQDYKVDDWQIDVIQTKYVRAVVANLMSDAYTISSTNPIKWRFVGDFKFTSPSLTDRSKDMTISVDLVKTLVNSDDIKIYDRKTKGTFINWSNFVPTNTDPIATVAGSIATTAAKVAYTGTVSGNTADGAKFRMIFDENNPLIRDFLCYADKVGGVVSTGTIGVTPRYQEFHPFIKGTATFTTGLDKTDINKDLSGTSTIYPRQIYFGNEDNPGLDSQCDNSALILIKGIGYKVDLRK